MHRWQKSASTFREWNRGVCTFYGCSFEYFRNFHSHKCVKARKNTHRHQRTKICVASDINRTEPTSLMAFYWFFFRFVILIWYTEFFRLIIWKVWNKVKAHCEQTNLFWHLYFVVYLFCVWVLVLCFFFVVLVCLRVGLFVWTHTHFRFINHWFVLPIWYFAQTHTQFTKNGQTTTTFVVATTAAIVAIRRREEKKSTTTINK